MTSPGALDQAIAALRIGRLVTIEGESPRTFLAVETATRAMLAMVDPDGVAPILISGYRAVALGLANERLAANPSDPVLIRRESWLDVDAMRQLANPGQDFDRPPAGPFYPLPLGAPKVAQAAIELTRRAGLLPALWLVERQDEASQIDMHDIDQHPVMTLAARAKLPLDGLPETQILAFRASDDGSEHVALMIGIFGGKPPLVRLHSECLTGDVFGSLKCDCGPQLKEALRLIGADGGGVLLYLRQEGRGIGLANKLRAYALQDRGFDTVEANARLGFADDERDYAHAAGMLTALGIRELRLLTNNPAKVAGLEAEGMQVVERVAHHMPANPHNADYLAVKRTKSGHLP